MSAVKRYDAVHIRYEESNIRYGEGCEVEMVKASDYDALAAECERIGRNRDMWKGQVESQATVIAELRAEVARLGADARRYQWLRDTGPRLTAAGPVIAMADADGSIVMREHGCEMLLSGADADDAIDAAMAQQEAGE